MGNKILFFDFETLSTKSSAIVLSLGMIIVDEDETYTFEQLEKEGIEIKFDIASQRKLGRHVSSDTIDWWKKQGDNAKRVLAPSKEDKTLEELPQIMHEFFTRHNFDPKKNHAYCRGHFDYPIIQDIFEMIGKECPIPFWNPRDIRTLIDCLTGSKYGKVPNWKPSPETILHNALHDCINDYLQIVRAYEIAYS